MILRSYLRLADASEKEVFDKTHITTFLSLFPPEPSGDDTSPPLLSGQSGMADRVGVKKKKKKKSFSTGQLQEHTPHWHLLLSMQVCILGDYG